MRPQPAKPAAALLALVGPLVLVVVAVPADSAARLAMSVHPSVVGAGRQTALVVETSKPAGVRVDLRDASGRTVRELARGRVAPEAPLRATWDGTLASGARAPDGRYDVVARIPGRASPPAVTVARILVDSAPPAFSQAQIAPEPVVSRDAVTARFRVWDHAAVLDLSYSVRRGASPVVRPVALRVFRGATTLRVSLRDATGRPLPTGSYRISLRAVDAAGNVATAAFPFRIRRRAVARVYERVPGARGMVALTFDDGNSAAAWRRILNTLAQRRVKASFFCTGTRVERYAALARRTLRDGHTVGSHSFDHALMPGRLARQMHHSLVRNERAWWRHGATTAPYFRPPYGASDAKLLRVAGHSGFSRVVLWDVDTQDWKRPGASEIARRAVRRARHGSIVLLHVQEQTAEALGPIITGLRKRGLRPVGLDELFAAAGRSLRQRQKTPTPNPAAIRPKPVSR